jgi:DNA-3-methyladenine glycosylase II
MIASNETIKQAAEHLAKNDSVLKSVIKQYGPCDIRPHTDYYQELVESIIGQQLSVSAARAIRTRFKALFPDVTFPSPEQILTKSEDELRAVGFSGAKARYVRDLAARVLDGSVKFDHLDTLSNDEIIAELTQVKGIGVWTAHMFMMFCMGRLDILATGDLGIKNGIQKLYGLDHPPQPREIEELAEQNGWNPYESVACWYVWQSLDNKPL